MAPRTRKIAATARGDRRGPVSGHGRAALRAGLAALLALCLAVGPAAAERNSLFPLGAAPATAALQARGRPAAPLIAAAPAGPDAPVPAAAALLPAAAAPPPDPGPSGGGSLFRDRAGQGLFAPGPQRPRGGGRPGTPRLDGDPAAALLGLIAEAEAGRMGYDAVQHGARIRPPKPPTQMTLGEIHAWIAATPGQPHAIGRYQFIPSTLRRVARIEGLGPATRFTPEVQDRLAGVLLRDAGLQAFEAGEMPRRTFMRNLARIWAGLPLPDGRSYYDGYAGNKATMSWARFEGAMARIWPGRAG